VISESVEGEVAKEKAFDKTIADIASVEQGGE
jgi:hypothetical protein